MNTPVLYDQKPDNVATLTSGYDLVRLISTALEHRTPEARAVVVAGIGMLGAQVGYHLFDQSPIAGILVGALCAWGCHQLIGD